MLSPMTTYNDINYNYNEPLNYATALKIALIPITNQNH